ncbi:metallophosphoesterase [Maledivibacter halophilus]|uniref:Calcineurin-like phosphoesterase domain-containing protein n=1 Tax=Maledivibacter halophilus TaxID=36842 RepID=A0A1T5IGY0_9FIRM|nr:metallophosphoesterase [Maledivibacter halophilus]SKC38424.1 hypothetical protein SAMN02194393_00369 [Maledivibacter halophilus]
MHFKKEFIITLSLAIMLISRIYFEIKTIDIDKISVKTKKIPQNKEFKIVHISDLHNKKLPNNSINLLDDIMKLNPNIIALTGDIIDAKTRDFDNIYNFLDNLIKINKNIYYVSGNHEWKNPKNQQFIKGLKNRKVKIINNTNRIIKCKDFSINICGIDDPYTNHENIDKAFNSIDNNNFTLLLSHSPDIIFKPYNLNCDLIICGHTHGGQIRFPFLGAIIAPGQGFFPKYDKGIFELERNLLLYINSGLGTSRMPIRFLNKSQISFITLTGE